MSTHMIADLLGHSVPEGETRVPRVMRGYAHGVPKRLRDAVNSLEAGKRAILAGTPSLCHVVDGIDACARMFAQLQPVDGR
jgi:hypothetical protein